MSATNREKRKQAKRKAREKKARAGNERERTVRARYATGWAPPGDGADPQELAEAQDEGPLYLRFGKPPKTGYSAKNLTAGIERGVSCYRGELENADGDRPRYVIDVSEPRLQRNLAIFLRLHTPAWLLAGEEVGTGGDGEPLLKVSRSWGVPGTVDLDADPHSWGLEVFLDLWNESDRKALSRKETDEVWRRELGGAAWP